MHLCYKKYCRTFLEKVVLSVIIYDTVEKLLGIPPAYDSIEIDLTARLSQ
jgi:hypothetical protein